MLNMAYHPKHPYVEGCWGAVCQELNVGLMNNVACNSRRGALLTKSKLKPFTFNNSVFNNQYVLQNE